MTGANQDRDLNQDPGGEVQAQKTDGGGEVDQGAGTEGGDQGVERVAGEERVLAGVGVRVEVGRGLGSVKKQEEIPRKNSNLLTIDFVV